MPERLQWNKRAINQAFEMMGLRNAITYGAGVGDHGRSRLARS
jgi:hypothetical protein